MLKHTMTLLGVMALATPAFAQSRTDTKHVNDGVSTYTPGHVAHTPDDYSLRNSAVAPRSARGGGPVVQPERHKGTVTPAMRGSQRIQSDNQTRRPGETNYTGASFKDGEYLGGETRSAHTQPEGRGVSMVGDSFTSRTASRTHGAIPVRATSSNENDYVMRNEPTAVGGGPAMHTRYVTRAKVVLPNGQIEALAPPRPIVMPQNGPAVAETETALTSDDLRELPFRGDGTAHPPGLLALDPTVRGDQLLDAAQAESSTPSALSNDVRFPAMGRAIGGGPMNPTLDHLLDRVGGR